MKKRGARDRAAPAASYLLRALGEFAARVDLTVYVAAKHTKTGLRAKRQDVTDLVELVAESYLAQGAPKRGAKRRD